MEEKITYTCFNITTKVRGGQGNDEFSRRHMKSILMKLETLEMYY